MIFKCWMSKLTKFCTCSSIWIGSVTCNMTRRLYNWGQCFEVSGCWTSLENYQDIDLGQNIVTWLVNEVNHDSISCPYLYRFVLSFCFSTLLQSRIFFMKIFSTILVHTIFSDYLNLQHSFGIVCLWIIFRPWYICNVI